MLVLAVETVPSNDLVTQCQLTVYLYLLLITSNTNRLMSQYNNKELSQKHGTFSLI